MSLEQSTVCLFIEAFRGDDSTVAIETRTSVELLGAQASPHPTRQAPERVSH